MREITTAVLHYSAPPVVGGVEAVMLAHAQTFIEEDYPVTIVSGRGDLSEFPDGTGLVLIPEMDSQHPSITQISQHLEKGEMPPGFEDIVRQLANELSPVLRPFDNVIIHNLFTKHFNLPLTAALFRLLDEGDIHHPIAWCHDFTWTSSHSRNKVHAGYPWDLLRTYRSDVTYVVVSRSRQKELAGLFECSPEEIHVVYNGVDPNILLGLSRQGQELINRLDLFASDLVLLMPVRVTQAKNIEFALKVIAALKGAGLKPKLILTGPPDPHDPESMAYFHDLQAMRGKLHVEHEMRFVFESGSEPDQPLMIDLSVVGDLFRVSDLMFMPSHREGFGMPILEAGLVGIPVVSTDVPAAAEIGGEEVIPFNTSDEPEDVARKIISWAQNSAVHQLRRRVRQNYTWRMIFERDIQPLLSGGEEH